MFFSFFFSALCEGNRGIHSQRLEPFFQFLQGETNSSGEFLLITLNSPKQPKAEPIVRCAKFSGHAGLQTLRLSGNQLSSVGDPIGRPMGSGVCRFEAAKAVRLKGPFLDPGGNVHISCLTSPDGF